MLHSPQIASITSLSQLKDQKDLHSRVSYSIYRYVVVVGCAVVLGQDECAVWIQSLLLEIKLLNRNLVV